MDIFSSSVLILISMTGLICCCSEGQDILTTNLVQHLEQFCRGIGFKRINSRVGLGDKWTSYYIIHKKLNFFDAYSYCEQEGLELATIESSGERQAIISAFTKNGNNLDDGFWISGTKLGRNNWYWKSGDRKVIYTNWYFGEPNNLFGQEDCFAMFAHDNQKYPDQWRDTSCYDKYRFVCQIKGAYPVPEPE